MTRLALLALWEVIEYMLLDDEAWARCPKCLEFRKRMRGE
jgi:hypothetical protein